MSSSQEGKTAEWVWVSLWGTAADDRGDDTTAGYTVGEAKVVTAFDRGVTGCNVPSTLPGVGCEDFTALKASFFFLYDTLNLQSNLRKIKRTLL